jgi:TonB family protein
LSRTFVHKARRRFNRAVLSLFRLQRRKTACPQVESPRQGRLPEDQITIEVLRYRVDHPEAMVKNGSATIYSNAFKNFLITQFERKPDALTRRQFACAAGIPAVTLRTWLPQSVAPLQTALPTVVRHKGIWRYIFADDSLNLWPSILKQNSRSRLALALVTAAFLHVIGLVGYLQFNREEVHAQTVRLMKYTEIVMPEIKAPPKQSWEDVVSAGRQPAAGMVTKNFEVVKPREKRPGEDAEANSEEAKLKKAGVLSMIEDDLAQGLDQVMSAQGMSTGKSLSTGRSSSGSADMDMLGLLGGLSSGENGKNGIDEILKNDVTKNKPAVKLTKTGKVNVEQLGKVSGSKEALGARTDESLRQVLAENMGRLQYLYNKYLKTNPEIGGKVEVEVAINADGTIANAAVLASEIGLEDFQREIIAAIRRWRYETITQGQVKVVYPIIFIKTS